MDDDSFKDWENHEEIPPGKLRDKWEAEEGAEKPAVTCAKCKKRVPATNLQCFYCGARIFQDSGFLGAILKTFKRIFNP